MNHLPLELENIILDYKYQLESTEKFNKVIVEINKNCIFNRSQKIEFSFGFVLYRVSKFKINDEGLNEVFDAVYKINGDRICISDNLEDFFNITSITEERY